VRPVAFAVVPLFSAEQLRRYASKQAAEILVDTRRKSRIANCMFLIVRSIGAVFSLTRVKVQPQN